jgi:hypothetical protein
MNMRFSVRRWRWVAVACLAALLPVVSGCYEYTTVDIQDLHIGTSVRARVTESASDSLLSALGYQTRTVEGTVVEVPTAQGLLLRVPEQPPDPNTSTQRLYQQILLSPSAIQELQTRHLSRARTIAMIGGIGLVLGYVLIRASVTGGAQGTLPSGGGGHPTDVVPIH